MPSYHIHVEAAKRLVDLLIEDDRGQRWEYGIPYDKRGGFAFEDIEAIRREFGAAFGDELWQAIEAAIAQRR
jgi:hypothetical protein